MSALHDAWEGVSDTVKHVGDVLSISAVVGVLLNMIPHATALLSFIYIGIRVWETETVRGWTGRDQSIRALRKHYQEAVNEPVPERLTDTLDKLK